MPITPEAWNIYTSYLVDFLTNFKKEMTRLLHAEILALKIPNLSITNARLGVQKRYCFRANVHKDTTINIAATISHVI